MFLRLFRPLAAFIALACMCTATLAQGSGFDVSRMERSTEACTDFFQYANGNWLTTTQIPASEARWGTFNILGDNNQAVLRDVLDTSAKTRAKSGTDGQLIGDFYSACMDEAAIERAGLKPVELFLENIDDIKTLKDVQEQIAEMHDAGLPAVFSFSATTDLKNTNLIIVQGFQGGLTLPNRDYYAKDDVKSVEVRTKFVEYMTNMFKLLGDAPEKAGANARTVLDLQTRLATASLTPVEVRNPDNRYNKISLTAAQELTPSFSWPAYLKERDVPKVTEVNLAPAKFFREVDAMMKDVSVEKWKTYLRWMTLNSASPLLPKAFADENFNFFGRYLSGQKERQPRWKQCVASTDASLGEALGMEFAGRTFKPEAKTRMNVLIDNLMAAMKDRINGLGWMSPDTKKQALTKLSTFKRKIGYPDVLRGYKGLSIDRDSHAMNVMKTNQFQIRRNFEDLGKPRDKTRWGFSPPTVNASYSPQNNEITFPAGILQPPFFNFSADDAINYGAIGGVIGHEITHGFDDQGSRFDAEGNLKMWWTDDDRKKFDERAACVVEQFNGYEVQPGLNINGRLTLGENIGDFAGLTVAYYAFKKSLEGKPRPANIDGFTPEQRFFLGWAQVWAGKYTSEAERQQVAGNVHSLPRWRVNGPVSNMPEFHAAFACKTGQKMVREKFCEIW